MQAVALSEAGFAAFRLHIEKRGGLIVNDSNREPR
jgi:hypothetical protein